MQKTNKNKYQHAMADLLKQQIPIRIPVFGYSMVPFLWPGYMAEIKPAAIEELKKGDVVLFKHGENLVLHRVLRLRGTEFVVCKGDARIKSDGEVLADAILGRLSAWKIGPSNDGWVTTNSARFKYYMSINLHMTVMAGCVFRLIAISGLFVCAARQRMGLKWGAARCGDQV